MQLAYIVWIVSSILQLVDSNSFLASTQSSEILQILKQELDSLLSEENYDIKQRPQCGGPPLAIAIGIQIEGIDKVSEVDMDYTLTFDVHHIWRDDRLVFKNTELSNISVTLDNRVIQHVWVPDIYLSNDKKAYKHEITRNNQMLRLQPDGMVYYGLRITAELECKMDLARYPMDEQICWMELESYGYTNQEIRFQLIDGKERSVTGRGNIKLDQFQLTGSDIYIKDTKFSRGDYSAAVLTFNLKRNLGFFILQTYVPSSLLTILSWISFWINYECTSARFALGMTSVLAITTISNSSRKSLPKIPDVKALDVFLIACFIFVFFGIMEYVFLNVVNYVNVKRREKQKLQRQKVKKSEKTGKRGKKKTDWKRKVSPGAGNVLRNRCVRFILRTWRSLPTLEDSIRIDDVTVIDKYARIGFPTAFVLFNSFYWTYYNFF